MRTFLIFVLLLLSPLVQAELAETDWLSLLTAHDRKALETMPEISHDTAEGDGVFTNKGGLKQQDKKLPAVMYSSQTVAALNGKKSALVATRCHWKVTPRARAPCSFWCPTRARVSMCRHHRPIS